MARNWKPGEHLTYLVQGQRVFGTIPDVGAKVGFELFLPGEVDGTATVEDTLNTGKWDVVPDAVFTMARDAKFKVEEIELQKVLKIEKMKMKRVK